MLQQRNQIIADLYTSEQFNTLINKMHPDHLRDDLRSEVMVILCSKPSELIIAMGDSGELMWYVTRVVLNMVRSNSSKFTKQYRMLFTDVIPEQQVKELNGRVHREFMEDKVKQYIKQELYWYDKEITEMYMRLGSFQLISKETGIPQMSCYKTVRRVIGKIRREVLNASE